MNILLVVDHNAEDWERYEAFLEGHGLHVVISKTGAEALSASKSARGSLAAAIVLWELAGVPSGAELLIELRRLHPRLPLIVVSGLLDLSRGARATALGACDFILKPFACDRLCSAVHDAILASTQPQDPLLQALLSRMVGRSPQFVAALEELVRLIPHGQDIVLLTGESGTGKELFAKALHDLGPCSHKPLVSVNVGSIPHELLESALFGHEKGAFTDATAAHVGYFQQAGTGTLFLDEIGELDASLQVKLLRVIEERKFRRVGGSEDLDFRARLVCATNRDLAEDIRARRFRQDLYFRISAHQIRLPPLRERGEDLWLLVDHFLNKHGRKRHAGLVRETREILDCYPFPGNVRELENVVRRALRESEGDRILPTHLPMEMMRQAVGAPGDTPDGDLVWPQNLMSLPQKEALARIERAFNHVYLPRCLQKANGVITRAAAEADLDPKTFRKKWEDCGLPPLSSREE